MSESWAGGSTRTWRKLRAAVLARDKHRCRLQIPGVCVQTSTPMHVHHTLGKARGDDPRYLIAACAPCNLHLGNPQRTADPPAVPVTNW